MRQQAKRSVPLPTVPPAYLVLIEADLSLGRFETVLYRQRLPAIQISSSTEVSDGP